MRRVGDEPQALEAVVHAARRAFRRDFLLVLEVVVERPDRHLQCGRDISHPGAVEPVFAECARSRAEVVEGFAQSREFVAKTEIDAMIDYMQGIGTELQTRK